MGPVYLRFGRLAVPVFHAEDYKFEIGKGEVLKDGNDVAIIANGLLTYEAILAGEELEKLGINARIINMATIKPIDKEAIKDAKVYDGLIKAYMTPKQELLFEFTPEHFRHLYLLTNRLTLDLFPS